MEQRYLFTSESVTEGHPDKLCDYIADCILDAYLKRDPRAHVACETTASTGLITVMGQITSTANVDIRNVVREAIRQVGYTDDRFGFNSETCAIQIMVDRQSTDIQAGVNRSLEIREQKTKAVDDYESTGAGDQGMMFGYACRETRCRLPAPLYYAHQLCKRLAFVRKSQKLRYLGPDGKAMVTFEYVDGKPVRVHTVVLSAQHTDEVDPDTIRHDLIAKVIRPMIPERLMVDTTILVNPSGRFVYGGPCADTGLTGRKIVVDTYGGAGHHGGGAFSGKDPTKVDRTGAYAARYIAKNIIEARIAERCEVQIAYAIGVARPVSVWVNTFGTGRYPDEDIAAMIQEIFDLRPAYLIHQFDLLRPIYAPLAAYGHFGRSDLDLAWENTDRAEEIQAYFAAATRR